jgi:3-deoxy-7-phosphoheptulonate synthase
MSCDRYAPPTVSWRSLPAAQQPDWPDHDELREVIAQLERYPPLVFADSCDRLRKKMSAVAAGEAFLLQAGDCAETFEGLSANNIFNKVRTILQMEEVLNFSKSLPVVKVGRIAGQYAKPRSHHTESRAGLTLPTYRGDCVNDTEFSTPARTPDPRRLERMYHASAATLNLLQAFTARSCVGPRQVHSWNEEFIRRSPARSRFAGLNQAIGRALDIAGAYQPGLPMHEPAEFYTSHEALVLDYECALTRVDPFSGKLYGSSGHLLWIGERTRQLNGAHIEFASRIHNPIAVKLGPTCTPADALALIERLNPDNEPGRLTFITRMGADQIRDRLTPLVATVTAAGAMVAWVCDPMHGNTFEAPSGYKTRRFADILDETKGFFEVHHRLGTHPGGIHLELTGDDVTECVGGSDEIHIDDLHQRYETVCDPRLNHSQSVELAFLLAEINLAGRVPSHR